MTTLAALSRSSPRANPRRSSSSARRAGETLCAFLNGEGGYLHAFATVREAITWLDRTLFLSARFPKGSILREDRLLPVPAEAPREIIINAVIHRDVSNRFIRALSFCKRHRNGQAKTNLARQDSLLRGRILPSCSWWPQRHPFLVRF